MKEWHAGAYRIELLKPDTSVFRDQVESLAGLLEDALVQALLDG
jgi:hypothetical protein